MTLNQIGAAVGIGLFGAILYLHGCKPDVQVRAPAPIAAPVLAPAPVAPHKEAPKVEAPAVEKFPRDIPCVGDGKCGPRSETKPVPSRNASILRRKPVYHRVLKNGEIDGPMDCKKVPTMAHEYPPETVIKYAKNMGVSPENLAKLRVCLN